MLIKHSLAALLTLLLLLSSSIIHAGEVRHIYVFGDSLSYDNNLNPIVKHIFRLPDTFSNDKPWNHYLGAYYQQYHLSYQNYSLPGSTATFQTKDWLSAPAFFKAEIMRFLLFSTRKQREESLIIIWIGSNDYILNYKAINAENTSMWAEATVSSIVSGIKQLMQYHCKRFVIMNLGDISTTPFATSRNLSDNMLLVVNEHNVKLANAIRVLKQQEHVAIELYDVSAFFDGIKADPVKFQLKNTIASCKYRQKICASPDDYFYWDHLHFTAKIHRMLATYMEQFIDQTWHLNS